MKNTISEYIKIKNLIKQLQVEEKQLGQELQSKITDKVEQDGHTISKATRTTYSLKKDVDIQGIADLYPEIVEQKVDAKELYKIATDPDQYVELKTSEYLTVRENKNKAPDLDF